MSIPETNPTTPRNAAWKLAAALGGLALVCCFAVVCYIGALTLIVERDVYLYPTPTLNAQCNDAECLNMCIARLPQFDLPPIENKYELSQQVQGYELVRYRLNEQTGQMEQVALPSVPEYLRPFQTDSQAHLRIWEYFSSIFPQNADTRVTYMTVSMNAAPEHYSASVQYLGGHWRLHINLYDLYRADYVITVLAHEYAHLLTLNDTQVDDRYTEYGLDSDETELYAARNACKGAFFNGYQCTRADSYLNAFGKRFWSGELYDAWVAAFVKADNDAKTYKTMIDDFYNAHSDQFLSPYAATNPREDIAVAWEEFILKPKPQGTSIAEQKVLFFYEYPELVELRRTIIQGVCRHALEQK